MSPRGQETRVKKHTLQNKSFLLCTLHKLILPIHLTLLIACNQLSLIHAHFGANFKVKILSKQPTIVFDFRHKIHTNNIIIPTRRMINPPDQQTKINIFYIYILSPISFEYLISYQQTLSLVNLRDTAVIRSDFKSS